MHDHKFSRFLVVRDDFYEDPDAVRARALEMTYRERAGITGYMSDAAYHQRGVRRRLEQALALKITRWDVDPKEGNGIFYCAFARGGRKEVPGVHYDEPVDDVTAVIYLTPGLPLPCGTSLWQHRSTELIAAPTRKDAHRLGINLGKLRDRLERDSEKRDRWLEVDRAGYKYNRMVAYPSGMLHSASRHFGGSLEGGRIYQTFRVGVRWD
jgi:hypothetical protein